MIHSFHGQTGYELAPQIRTLVQYNQDRPQVEPEVRDYPEIPEVVTLSVAPEEHRHQFGTGENIT